MLLCRRRALLLHRRSAALVLLLCALVSACSAGEAPPGEAPDAAGWHAFEGSWTAAGRRKLLPFGPGRQIAVVDVSGSLLLSGAGRPALGFRGEALTFADDTTGLVGRAIWTDERGDQLYSELGGERAGEKIVLRGRFVGGSGRYAGAEGDYSFEWNYLIESEDGHVQGRTQGLAGRVRLGGQGQALR